MASLLVAASYLTYNKIKDKRAAKKEAKRKSYEARYNELEREHSQHQVKQVQTGSSQGMEQSTPTAMAESQSQQIAAERRRRSSSESGRASMHSGDDDPSAWVNDVLKEHEKRGGSGQSQ